MSYICCFFNTLLDWSENYERGANDLTFRRNFELDLDVAYRYRVPHVILCTNYELYIPWDIFIPRQSYVMNFKVTFA